MQKTDQYTELNEYFLKRKREEVGVKELCDGILYEEVQKVQEVQGKTPGPRSIVTCHYRGSTINGRVFDETFSSGCPAAFRVCDLIQGFQAALMNMHIGDHWRVYIPSRLGYGRMGAGRDIPGNSTLIFEIQLLGIS